MTLILGVAALPSGGVDAWAWDRLVQRADRAQKAGRNRVEAAGGDR